MNSQPTFLGVPPWSSAPNTETGGGYGVQISQQDRDRYFRRHWGTVLVELEGQEEVVTVSLSCSFWCSCPELRKKEIGAWMLDKGLAPWPFGHPPKLKHEPRGGARFRLSK